MGDLFARRFKRSILSVDMMINVKEEKRKERKGKEEKEKRGDTTWKKLYALHCSADVRMNVFSLSYRFQSFRGGIIQRDCCLPANEFEMLPLNPSWRLTVFA